MAAKQGQVPKFGNWETAESVPYTHYFDQARRKKIENAPSTHSENSGDPAKPQLDAEITKPRNSKPRRDEGNHHRHADPAYHTENQRRHNKTYAGSYEGKPAERAGNNPPPERRSAVESATPARTRTNHGDRVHRTPLRDDVTVPPFAEWDENDPSSGEKYTGIFKTIADNRRTPGTPYQPPEPRNQNQEITGAKDCCCGCLSWFSK